MRICFSVKFLLLFLLFKGLAITVIGQPNFPTESQEMLTMFHKAASERRAFSIQQRNTPPPLSIPANYLDQPYLLHQAIQPFLSDIRSESESTNRGRRTNNLCKDTSYSRLLSVYNGRIYIQSVSQTAAGDVLVSALMYDSTIRPNPYAKSYGLLIKLNSDGDVIWLKQFEELTPGSYNSHAINRAFELPNGDIICTGQYSNNGSSSVYQTIVYRLNSNGDILWKNTLKSTIGIFNSPSGTFTFFVESATEGLNGDVILCGTSNSNLSSGKIQTVIRLNNLGQLVWDANYGNHGVDGSYLLGAEGISAFVQNGNIILVGLSHGNTLSQPPAINFLTLNYSSGQLMAKRFFRPDYTDPAVRFDKGFTYWANKWVRLTNGHYLFYGKLFSDFVNRTALKDHYGVVEFDASFNLVKAYSIRSTVRTNYYNNQMLIDPSGRGLITTFEYINGFEGNLFFGTFHNQQFQHQRKAHYTNVGMPGNNGFAFLPNNAYAYVQTYFLNTTGANSFFEFRKMHNSDTSSPCLGKDTLLLGFSHLNIVEDPGYPLLDPNEPNKFVASTNTISQTDTLSTASTEGCKQINYCDTIKIHGQVSICGNASSLTFTAFKNAACGGIVQWDINRNGIDSLRVLSDSSVTVWFSNNNWYGKLYASVPASGCFAPAIDSVVVSITRGQIPVNLGADKTLCLGNTIELNARKGYASYLWQDGSTDSTFIVTQPGLYYVTTTDACGGIFKDSVLITAAPPIPFDIGPDRVKCNRDTLHLSAPPGFINYSWSNNYNINSTTSQNVVVNPLLDTAYYVRAEKPLGCFAYDTVRVKVYHSPAIDLGDDKSFCFGDSAVFDAGSGFQSYVWSNYSVSQLLVAKAAGKYSVIGTTAEGCKSYDTVEVLQVHPLPVISLDKNSALCAGETKTLNPGSFPGYLWNTGETTPSITVSDVGTYKVTVTDAHGCSGSDSTEISTIFPLPAGFLPVDTAICSYGVLELKPTASFDRYLWSTASSQPVIRIEKPGLYWLEVTDRNTCKGRDSIVVNPKNCMSGFYAPSAFTPNGDLKNDNFMPLLFGNVKKYRLTIYNRWGQVVFSTTEQFKGWDGKVGGTPHRSDVFVWVCAYQFEGDSEKTEKGTITLIR